MTPTRLVTLDDDDETRPLPSPAGCRVHFIAGQAKPHTTGPKPHTGPHTWLGAALLYACLVGAGLALATATGWMS